MTQEKAVRHYNNQEALPEKFPTHLHEAVFWESLGRAVATFGFLEEILEKAIFAFTATRVYKEEEVIKAYDEWLPKLERALIDPLGNLIDSYGAAVRAHQEGAAIGSLDDLLVKLHDASKTRNVLCHGSWRVPDTSGASTPFFVNRQNKIFDIPIDREYLDQVQRDTADLVCEVIHTVTQRGLQFPGSAGPGKTI